MAACPWSAEARDAGIWAIDVLQAELGPKWPKAWRAPGAAPPELAKCWFLLSAYAYTLDLALGFALLRDQPGIGGVRSVLKQTSREDALASPRLQLRLASVGLSEGYAVALEPRLAGGESPADLRLAKGSTRIGAEVFALLRDQKTVAADEWMDSIAGELGQIGARCEVDFRGSVEGALSAAETEELLEELRSRAPLAGRGFGFPDVTIGAVSVKLVPAAGPGGERSFQMPHVHFDRRLKNRLRAKAEQTRKSKADWLVIDSLDQLWHMTGWAQQSLAAKARALSAVLREALDREEHLLGVVITDGAGLMRGEVDEETPLLERGIVARRRRLDWGRSRESVVVPLRDGGLAGAEAWGRILDAEHDWLARALETQGVAPPPELAQ